MHEGYVLPEALPVPVNQLLAVLRLLVLKLQKDLCGRGKTLPEALGEIAINVGVLFLEGDCQRQYLAL